MLLFRLTLPLEPRIAARARDSRQHVMRQFEMGQAEPLFRAQHAAIDQRVHVRFESLLCGGMTGHRRAEAVRGQQPILDERARAGIEIRKGGVVEIAQDVRGGVVDEVGGNLGEVFPQPSCVELPAHETQEGRIDRQVFEGNLCVRRRDLPDDLLGNVGGHQAGTGQQHRAQSLSAIEAGECEPVVHHRGHHLSQPIEPRDEILAQGDQHLVMLLGYGRQRVAGTLEALAHVGRNVVLHQVRELGQQPGAPGWPLPRVNISSN